MRNAKSPDSPLKGPVFLIFGTKHDACGVGFAARLSGSFEINPRGTASVSESNPCSIKAGVCEAQGN